MNTKEDKVNLYEGLLPNLVSPDPNMQHDHKFLNGTQFCVSWNVDNKETHANDHDQPNLLQAGDKRATNGMERKSKRVDSRDHPI